MKKIFASYLDKFLNLYFFNYPQDLVPDLFSYFESTYDILILDIQAKYPKHEKINLLDDALFHLLQLDTTIEAIFYYRLERAIFLKNPDHPLLPYLANLMKIKTGIELYYSTEIGQGLIIQHSGGIVVGPRNKIGSNCLIYQGVTIGQRRIYSPNECTFIGNNVTFFAGAKIIGSVKIGDNVKIGANAVLLNDAEPDSTYVGVPARKLVSVRSHCKDEVIC